MRTYIFYDDPGHGWLEVPLKELELLPGLLPTISGYSYTRVIDGKWYLWLEEDCDASKFHLKMEAMGLEYKHISKQVPREIGDIRAYPRWSYQAYRDGFYGPAREA